MERDIDCVDGLLSELGVVDGPFWIGATPVVPTGVVLEAGAGAETKVGAGGGGGGDCENGPAPAVGVTEADGLGVSGGNPLPGPEDWPTGWTLAKPDGDKVDGVGVPVDVPVPEGGFVTVDCCIGATPAVPTGVEVSEGRDGVTLELDAPGDGTGPPEFSGRGVETEEDVPRGGLTGATPDAWLGVVVTNPLRVHVVVVPIVVVELHDVTVVLQVVHATLCGNLSPTTEFS